MANGFDLDTAPNIADAEEQGFTFQLVDVEGEPMSYEADGEQRPVTWTVVGAYSKTCRDIERKQLRSLLKNARNGAKQDDAAVAEANSLERAVACTRGFDGFFAAGKVFPFTAENARLILSSPKGPHILRQVNDNISAHGNFTGSRSAA